MQATDHRSTIDELFVQGGLFRRPGAPPDTWPRQIRDDVDRDLPTLLKEAMQDSDTLGSVFDFPVDWHGERGGIGVLANRTQWLNTSTISMITAMLHAEFGGALTASTASDASTSPVTPGQIFFLDSHCYTKALENAQWDFTTGRVALDLHAADTVLRWMCAQLGNAATVEERTESAGNILRTYRLFVMPCNLDDSHWALGVVDVKSKTIKTWR